MIDNKNMLSNRKTWFIPIWNSMLLVEDINCAEEKFLADVLAFKDGGYYKTNAQIARVVRMKKTASVTAFISRLVKKGYIIRKEVRNSRNEIMRVYTIPTEKLHRIVDGGYHEGEKVYESTCEAFIPSSERSETPPFADGGAPVDERGLHPLWRNGAPPLENGVKNTYIENTCFENTEEDKSSSSKPVSTQKKKKVFSPPTREEAQAYHAEKGYGFDLDEFFDYYEPRDWRDKSGRKISSWKSCMATFERNRKRWAAERQEEEETARRVEEERKARNDDDWALWDRNLQYAQEREEEEKKLREKKGLMEGGTLYAT